MDVVSNLLASIRLTGGTFLRIDLRAPFSIETMSGVETCVAFGHRYEHVIPYHLVVRGSCWARVHGENPLQLDAGQIILLPRGEPHTLASDTQLRATKVTKFLPPTVGPGPLALQYGGKGAATQIICGYLACERQTWNPLVQSLPRLLAVDTGRGSTAKWLKSSLEFALAQTASQQVGMTSQLARLSELMFVEALRRYVERLPASSTGWLRAAGDRHLGKALSLLHAEPQREWRIETLAAAVGLSRSAFATRFERVLGMTPMTYLRRWRMQVAAKTLRESQRSIASIALDCGYASEAAFIRAFAREFSASPARWRRSHGDAGSDLN